MAYATELQYGAPPRPYHGACTAPLTVPAEHQEPISQVQSQSYDFHPNPSLATSREASQHHSDEASFMVPEVQRQNYDPRNGYSEPYHRGQTPRPQGGNYQRLEDVHSLEKHAYLARERYGQPGVGYQQSFSRPRLQQRGTPQLPSEMRSPQSYNEPRRPNIPLPRSFSNDSHPQINLGLRSEGQNFDGSLKIESYHRSDTNQSNTNHGNSVSIHARAAANLKKPAAKERIIIEPSSPETISWDNPFPTFPTPKKKVLQIGSDSFNGGVTGGTFKEENDREGFQSQKPQADKRKINSESSQSNWQGIDGNRRPERRSDPQDHDTSQTNRMYDLGRYSSFEKVAGSGRTSKHSISGIHGNTTGLGDQHQLNNQESTLLVQAFNRHEKDPAGSAWPQSMEPNYSERSQTLPNQISQALATSYFLASVSNTTAHELPFNQSHPSSQSRNHALLYQPLVASEVRTSTPLESLSDEKSRVQPQEPVHQPSFRRTTHVQRSKHGDFPTFYPNFPNEESSKLNCMANGGFSPLSKHERSKESEVPLQGRDDLQNHKVMVNQDLHFPDHGSDHKISTYQDSSRGRPGAKSVKPGLAGQAHRSQSQPNLKEQQPRSRDRDHMFDFGNIPEVPGMPLTSPQSCRTPPLGREMYVPTKGRLDQSVHDLNYSRQPSTRPVDLKHDQNHPPTNRHFMMAHSNRSINSSQRRPATPTDQWSNLHQASSALQSQWIPSMQEGNPENSSSSNKLINSTSSPINRSYNSDALPEHPAPVRPGLMQTSIPHQAGKPPPVRQYETIPYPTQQSTMSGLPESVSLQPSSEKLRGVTHQELERLRQLIRTNPDDCKAQLALANMMVQAANVLADDGGRADQKQCAKNRERYILDAHKLVKRLVSSGYPEAMFYLADCHGRGLLGLEIDPKEAFNLYQSAAKAGHPQSAYRMAVCCELGQEEGGGTRRDPLKAIQWYKRAATLGDTPAMYKMGMIQLKGLLGQPRNPREAIVWLKRAAERADKENPHSLHELGLLFETASGNDNIIRDEAYSRQLFAQAADLGYKFSQYRLGSAYEFGLLGCLIDPRQSIAWYSRAAVQEEHQSELSLSGWYLTGSEGVLQQSDTEAYLWARKAAQAGLAKAEYAMGYFTEVGIGTPANTEDAKRWYWRASTQNHQKARERLEDLRKGGARMQKSRVSRSAVNKQSDGDCIVM